MVIVITLTISKKSNKGNFVRTVSLGSIQDIIKFTKKLKSLQIYIRGS